MPTAVGIINLGLGKIGASRVTSIAPATSAIEQLAASGFQQWLESELTKRRWVFATTKEKLSALPAAVDPLDDDRMYKFARPGDILRPIRSARDTWVQRGNFYYNEANTFYLEYIRKPAVNELTDPLFVDVLACRCALELAEPATQNPKKQQNAVFFYNEALQVAAKNNAFTMDEGHPTEGNPNAYSWDVARYNPEVY